MAKRVSAYLEQEILSASPLELVHILYQAAIGELRDARRNMALRDIPAKCGNINNASKYIGELLCSLDLDAGGDIAARLKGLYEYMLSRLLFANFKNQDEPLAEIISLLSNLDEAWKQLAEQRLDTAAPGVTSGISPGMFCTDGEGAAQVWSF
jgi:flagellar protein FliS